jgi:two-component system, NarL family, sensor kinase
MRYHSVVILSFVFCISIGANAQHYNRDSMISLIDSVRKTVVDTGHIRLLREWAYDIGENDSVLSKQLLIEAIDKSEKINDAGAMVNSYRLMGLWYKGVGNMDRALDYYQASLKIAKQNNFWYLMAGAYFEISNIKYWKGEYDSCIDYCLKTQAIFESSKVFEHKALTNRILDKKKSDLYSNMSSVFNTLKNLPKADEYIDKAIAIANSYNSNKMVAIYTQQKADNYFENGNIEKALRIRLKKLQVMEDSGVAKTLLQAYYQHISQEYLELGKIDSAKIFAQQSLVTAGELEVPDAIANANWQMGKIALKEKQFTLAETYFKKCSAYFLQSQDPTEKRSYYAVLHQLCFETGRYKEAYQYFQNYSELNDTILDSERSKQFSDREAKYQSEKKDAQIEWQNKSLRQRKMLNSLLAGSALALLIISLLTYRNYKQKQRLHQQRISELETEKQLTATEAVLKGEEQERTRLAKDLHDGLGGMLSGIKYSFSTMKGNLVMTPENAQAFERSMDMLDSSIKEMRRVAHNMMPEALVKFGLDTALKDFCNDISNGSPLKVNYQSLGLEKAEIDQTTAITIYRIVQELINNTLKHAVATTAIVQISKIQSLLSVTVEDDGNGFDTTLLRFSNGIGWSNIQSRLNFLKGKCDIQSTKNKGTSVHIEVVLE